MAHRRCLRIYLAGPDVFLPNALLLGARKKELCLQHGFEGLFPLDDEIRPGPGERPDRLIFAANVEMIRRADIGIFNLSPFRGPSADAGTIFELGFMAGLGKRLIGYTNAATPMLSRVVSASRRPDGSWQDKEGFSVEDFGNSDNLMIDSCLALDGNALFRCDAGGRLDDLDGFELCLRHAATMTAKAA